MVLDEPRQRRGLKKWNVRVEQQDRSRLPCQRRFGLEQCVTRAELRTLNRELNGWSSCQGTPYLVGTMPDNDRYGIRAKTVNGSEDMFDE